jgi:hypothetical protein
MADFAINGKSVKARNRQPMGVMPNLPSHHPVRFELKFNTRARHVPNRLVRLVPKFDG